MEPFTLVTEAARWPQECVICRNQHGPMVDTGAEKSTGWVYLCGRCTTELFRLLDPDRCPTAERDAALEQTKTATARAEHAEAEAAAAIDGRCPIGERDEALRELEEARRELGQVNAQDVRKELDRARMLVTKLEAKNAELQKDNEELKQFAVLKDENAILRNHNENLRAEVTALSTALADLERVPF